MTVLIGGQNSTSWIMLTQALIGEGCVDNRIRTNAGSVRAEVRDGSFGRSSPTRTSQKLTSAGSASWCGFDVREQAQGHLTAGGSLCPPWVKLRSLDGPPGSRLYLQERTSSDRSRWSVSCHRQTLAFELSPSYSIRSVINVCDLNLALQFKRARARSKRRDVHNFCEMPT
jgi:hypothetical protein